jgi:hypothetical protein
LVLTFAAYYKCNRITDDAAQKQDKINCVVVPSSLNFRQLKADAAKMIFDTKLDCRMERDLESVEKLLLDLKFAETCVFE